MEDLQRDGTLILRILNKLIDCCWNFMTIYYLDLHFLIKMEYLTGDRGEHISCAYEVIAPALAIAYALDLT